MEVTVPGYWDSAGRAGGARVRIPPTIEGARSAVHLITATKGELVARRRSHDTREVVVVIIVQHKVLDFDSWKPVFDEHGDVRRRHGATGHEIYRAVDDSNDITIVNHFQSKEGAEAFSADPSLKEAMARGGVISEPRITYAEETETAEY
jgi:heme-degrading monooxygenase HmoA